MANIFKDTRLIVYVTNNPVTKNVFHNENFFQTRDIPSAGHFEYVIEEFTIQ